MLAILDAISDTLPPTRTYARRSFVWVPADVDRPEPDGRLGLLSIKLQHSKSGVRRAVECDSYSIERDATDPSDLGGVAFWLMNTTDPEAEEVYRCVVGGMKPKCTCRAGKCRVVDDDGELICKHYSALTWLTERGFL